MKLMSFHVFLKNMNTVVILKCSKSKLGNYFSKGFAILECNYNNLAKILKYVKKIDHEEETDNSDKVVTCINIITSTLNTLKNLLVNKSYIFTILKKKP